MFEIILPLLLLFGLFVFVYVFRIFSIRPYTPHNFSKDPDIKNSLQIQTWAEANQFQLEGCYTIQEGLASVFAVVWQSKEVPCYLTFWKMKAQEEGGYLDFDTSFQSGYTLTTTNSVNANLLPTPKQFYKQNFSGINIDELYIKHLEAIDFLVQEGRLMVLDLPSEYVTSVTNHQNQERRFAWRHWYYGLLVFYFMLFRNRRFRNKTIQQQHSARLIAIPAAIERDMYVAKI